MLRIIDMVNKDSLLSSFCQKLEVIISQPGRAQSYKICRQDSQERKTSHLYTFMSFHHCQECLSVTCPLRALCQGGQWLVPQCTHVRSPYPSEGGRSQAPEAVRKAEEGVLITESKIVGENSQCFI